MLWWCYFRWKNVGQKVTKEIRFWFTTFFFLASVPTNRLSLIYYTDRWKKEFFGMYWSKASHLTQNFIVLFNEKKIIEAIWYTRIFSSLNDFCYHKIIIMVISSNWVILIRFIFWQHFKVPTAWLLFEQIMLNSNNTPFQLTPTTRGPIKLH